MNVYRRELFEAAVDAARAFHYRTGIDDVERARRLTRKQALIEALVLTQGIARNDERFEEEHQAAYDAVDDALTAQIERTLAYD